MSKVKMQNIENELQQATVSSLTRDGTDKADKMEGSNQADVLSGLAGDDIIYGNDGNDLLRGNAGKDLIFGGAGDDKINGGRDDDFLRGDLGNDYILGGHGNDDLRGNQGDDLLSGGEGFDILNGGNGSDTADYSDASHPLSAMNVQLNDDGTGHVGLGRVYVRSTGEADIAEEQDTLISIENIVGTGGDDEIIGNSASNNFKGGAGRDFLQGGAGNDILDGGDGEDTASYWDLGVKDAVFVQLSDDGSGKAVAVRIGAGGIATYETDTLRGIENLQGGAGSDHLVGNSGSNLLYGGDGNDELDGGAGDDILSGGNGDNIFVGGKGRDRIFLNADSKSEDTILYEDVTDGGNIHDGFDVIKGFSTDLNKGADRFDLGYLFTALDNASGEFTTVAERMQKIQFTYDKEQQIGHLFVQSNDQIFQLCDLTGLAQTDANNLMNDLQEHVQRYFVVI